jgi:Cupin superfamily protein
VFEMDPGDAVYVPPHAPHMVKNGPTASISFSITFRTPELERIQRVSSINARIRRLGLTPKPPGRRPAVDRLKASTSRALGRARRVAG